MATIPNKLVFLLLLAPAVFFGPMLSAQDLKTAMRLTENEQFAPAWEMYEAMIAKEAANSDYYFFYGESRLKSYFSDSANTDFNEVIRKSLALYQKGIGIDSANPLNHVGVGKIALFEGDEPAAKRSFNKAISLLPTPKTKKTNTMPLEKQVQVYQRIAEAYLKSSLGDTGKVFPYLDKAEKLDKKDPITYLLRGDAYLFLINDGSNAIFNYKKAQDLDPNSPRAKLRLGQLWVRAKRPMDALTYYQEALQIDSTFAPAYRELAELYRLAAQYDNAQRMYGKFLELNQNNLSAKVRYASFLFLSKNYSETIGQSQEVLKVDPSYNFLNRLIGYSAFETNQHELGQQYMETFFKQTLPDKVLPSDYDYYGRILAKLGKDSLAILEFEKAFGMDSTNLEVLGDMISSYNKMKKYDQSARIYEMRISRTESPTYADYLNLGKTYYQAQNWDMADSALAKVISIKPDLIQAYMWRARVYANKDPETKEGLAKPFYEQIIEQAAADSVKYSKELIESYKYLAYFFFKNKKWCESLDYWQKVEAIEPNDEQARSAIKDLKARCVRK